MAGVAVRRRGALLGDGAARVQRAVRVPRALAGAVLVRRRRVPAAAARSAAAVRRAAAVPRVVAGAGAALAAVAAVAPVGGRLDPLVAAARVRPQLRTFPELGRRLFPDASVSFPTEIAATERPRSDARLRRSTGKTACSTIVETCAPTCRCGFTASSS